MIKQAKIPFADVQESGWEALAGASPAVMNVVLDGRGSIRRRPGIATHTLGSSSVSSSPIVGLHSDVRGNVYAVAASLPGQIQIYKLGAGTAPEITTSGTRFIGITRPTIAETEALLVFATGGEIKRLDLATNTVASLSVSAPRSSHIVALGSRLLANDAAVNTSQIHYSAPSLGSGYTGHEQWSAVTTALGQSGFFTAEARPDPVVAIAENSNEVFVFGSTTVQTFAADASFVYAPVSVREHGCATPFGIIRDDQFFAWMDDRRRIVRSDGRGVEVLSDPIKKTLDALSDVSGCFAYRVVLGEIDCLVWMFPSDGRSFAYQKGGGWSQWMGWSNATNNFSPLTISAHTSIKDVNDNLVGTSSGGIGVFRSDTYTDLGEPLPAFVTTGFLDRGTDNRKHCRSIKLVLRRGHTQTAEPLGMLQYRNDEGAWSSPIEVSLGISGDRSCVVEIRSLGVYRRRQWRLSFQGAEEFVLAAATEEYDILSN